MGNIFKDIFTNSERPEMIHGIVSNYASLPTVSLHSGEFYLVENPSGIYLINRKPRGIYYSNGSTWESAPDIIPFFDDDNFVLYDNADNTKKMNFELSGITTGSKRTITPPDYNFELKKPLVDYIDFNTAASVAMQEGRFSWNIESGTLTIGMPGGNVELQLGQEIYLPDRPKNTESFQIDNGKVVYLDSATGAVPEVKLANASKTSGSKTIAVVTENVASGQRGYFVTFGALRDYDTSFGSDGEEVFLDETDGGITTDKLSHPNFRIKIGYIIRSHATEGVLFVNIKGDQWLKRFQSMGEPTGFDRLLPDSMGDISFTAGTRTFEIAVHSGEDYFSFWSSGREYRKTSTESVIISDTEGLWFIYYTSGGVLTASQTPWDFTSGYSYVAILYWDAINKTNLGLGEERHGITMDSATHEYLHNYFGALWQSGFTPSVTVDGAGSNDADCELQSVSAGVFNDEDIELSSVKQTGSFIMLYKDGSGAYFRKEILGNALVAITTTRPDYNEYTGGAWQRTEVANTKFTLTHLFAANSVLPSKSILVMGENQYNSKADAQEGAKTELTSLMTGALPTPEFISIASFIIECKDSFSNSYNARVVSTSDGNEFVDFRVSERTGVGASATIHANLIGLTVDDHEHYALIAGRDADYISKTSDYTATAGDTFIALDGTSNTVTLTLPTAVGIQGKWYAVKTINIDNACDVNPNGAETIDGVVTHDFASANESMIIISDGTNWQTFSSSLYSDYNPIINGNMAASQRGTSFAAIATANYSLDRYRYNKAGTMIHTITQDSDVPPNGLSNHSLKIDCTTIDAAIAAGDACMLSQIIEGYNLSPMVGKTYTLGFWFKATKIGIYCVAFRNSLNDRSYVSEVEVYVTDQWEFKAVTITFDYTGGTWDYANGIGLDVSWCLSAGTNFHGVADTWNSANDIATSNQVNACDNVTNNVWITQIQWDEGEVALPFRPEAVESNLARCKRYYEKSYDTDNAPGTVTDAGMLTRMSAGSTSLYGMYNVFSVKKRTLPSMVWYSNTSGGAGLIRDISGATDVATTGTTNRGTGSTGIPTIGGARPLNNIIAAHYTADAEL